MTALLLALLAAWTLPGPQDVSELVGKPAPGFRLERLTGGEIALADLRGRPVVLVLGCTREAAPPSLEWMVALEEAFEGREVFLFQIAILDNPWYIPEAAAKMMLEDFVPERGRPMVLIEWGKDVAQAYGIPRDNSVRVVLLDATGVVRWHQTGLLNPARLSELMAHL